MTAPTPADLRHLREQHSLTLNAAAELLRVDRMTVWRWEQGRSPMPPMAVWALQWRLQVVEGATLNESRA